MEARRYWEKADGCNIADEACGANQRRQHDEGVAQATVAGTQRSHALLAICNSEPTLRALVERPGRPERVEWLE
jgi:hypothetical protein